MESVAGSHRGRVWFRGASWGSHCSSGDGAEPPPEERTESPRMNVRRNHEMGRILVAEDEEGLRTFLAEALEAVGHEVVAVGDGLTAIATLRKEPFDVVLTDLKMPGADGMTVVRTARLEQPDLEVIVLTAHGGVTSAVEAIKLGAFDYVEKPIASLASVSTALARLPDRLPPKNV
mgnify:CR=1 FL=1